jgi:predicted dehydrogenase
MPRGVGIIGAGPGVAALHLPTLDQLGGGFRVVHLSDRGSGRAKVLAERLGARASQGVDDLLADPAVDVVAVCSPPADHAGHILAAVAAGARGIFCEKPLATTRAEALEVVDACRRAGVVLVIATNHFYDEAWDRAKHHLLALESDVRTVTVTVALPPNDRYHALVTDPSPAVASTRGAPNLSDLELAAAVVRQLVLGLAVHDLPAIRDLAPDFEGVDFATPVVPIGYTIGFRSSGVPIVLSAVMLPDGADALWRLSIGTSTDRVDVEFPPSFVHAGSATVRARTGDIRTTAYRRDAEDGYVREWKALDALLDGATPMEYGELLDDALFTIDLADAAAAAIRDGEAA